MNIVTIELPANSVGLVIGCRGKNIKKLRQMFGMKMHVDEHNRLIVHTKNATHVDNLIEAVQTEIKRFLTEKQTRIIDHSFSATLVSSQIVPIHFLPFNVDRSYFHIRSDQPPFQLTFSPRGEKDQSVIDKACFQWDTGVFCDSHTEKPAKPTHGDFGILMSDESSVETVLAQVKLRRSAFRRQNFKMRVSLGKQLFVFTQPPESRNCFTRSHTRALMRAPAEMKMLFYPIIPVDQYTALEKRMHAMGYKAMDNDEMGWKVHYTRFSSDRIDVTKQTIEYSNEPQPGLAPPAPLPVQYDEPVKRDTMIKGRPVTAALLNPRKDKCDVMLRVSAMYDAHMINDDIAQALEVANIQPGTSNPVKKPVLTEAALAQHRTSTFTISHHKDIRHDDAYSVATTEFGGNDTMVSRCKKRWMFYNAQKSVFVNFVGTRNEDTSSTEDMLKYLYLEVYLHHSLWTEMRFKNISSDDVETSLKLVLCEAKQIASDINCAFISNEVNLH